MGKVSKALEKASQGQLTTTDEMPNGINKKRNITFQKTPHRSVAKKIANPLNPNLMNMKWDERVLMSSDTTSPIFENFKRLRSKILHPPSGSPPKTILITSVLPEEGKGFVCANLGISLAKGMNQHALLVDCDLRKPSLANIFGLPMNRGVTDFLQKNIDLSLLIQKTGLSKLSIIASGTPPNNPSELLDSKKMITLINELASRYDDRFIVFDSPPYLVASETLILSKHVDGVVIVVKWGGPDREQVKKLVDAIGKDKVIGIVFNAYEKSAMANYLTNRNEYESYQKYYR